jgi:hypothetical protein
MATTTSLKIIGSKFEGNVGTAQTPAKSYGGAVAFYGGNRFQGKGRKVSISKTEFVNNKATLGGAFYGGF